MSKELLIVGENTIRLPGVQGKLEGVVTCPEQAQSDVIAIICHPHSLHGGTMNNKVVTTIARVFRELGVVSLRFNMRGVGSSEGEYDAGVGEGEDLRVIIEQLRQDNPKLTVYLAGFSFGSYVAYRVADLADFLISVAPPVGRFDFAALPLPECPWWVLQGEKDEVVAPKEVFSWLDSLSKPPQVLRFANTGHFFHGKLLELKHQLLQILPTYE